MTIKNHLLYIMISFLLQLCAKLNILCSQNFFSNITTLVPTLETSTLPPTLRTLPPLVINPNETEHVKSATVRIHSPMKEVTIHYMESVMGSNTSQTWLTCKSGDVIVVDEIGVVEIKAYATKEGFFRSALAVKKYKIIDRCEIPKIIPNGGTHAGSVLINFSSSTLNAIYCYRISKILTTSKKMDNDDDFTCLDGGISSFQLSGVGIYEVDVFAKKDNFAASPVAKAKFTLEAKVATPVIGPDLDTFTTSALLFVHCSTPNSTMFFTTDGSNPTETSLTVARSGNIEVDGLGEHTIKVFAVEPSMLPSDVATKTFRILERALPPQLQPPPGRYIGDVRLIFKCIQLSSSNDAVVYYTTDGTSTPSINSKSVPCGGSIRLIAPGKYVVRSMTAASDKSPSSVNEGVYILIRRQFDEYKANSIDDPFDIQPQVSVKVIEKDFNVGSYCERNVRGRLATLKNPVGHFHILPPSSGCSSGQLQLPSVSGRAFQPKDGFDLSDFITEYLPTSDSYLGMFQLREDKMNELPAYLKRELNGGRSISLKQLLAWKASYGKVKDLGCQLVTNAGFFNTSNFHCLGDIVSDGRLVQSSSTHNVKFGLRNGTFAVGYLESEEVSDPRNPFDFLVTGLGWLVRGGQSYIQESFSPSGDNEDQSMQTTGAQFAAVLSARTAIGLSKSGNLMILQVEGETWKRGMNLNEFASLAVELGFDSAINLDGGGSATMTQNHSLVSEPSWKCQVNSGVADDDSSNLLPSSSSNLFRCEKKVASITCMHAMPPPFVADYWIQKAEMNVASTLSPSPTPTLKPSTSPTESPSDVQPSESPTIRDFFYPTPLPFLRAHYPSPAPAPLFYESAEAPTSESQKSDDWWTTMKDSAYGISHSNSTAIQIAALQNSLLLYQLSSLALLIGLFLSLLAHCVICIRNRRRKAREGDSELSPYDNHGGFVSIDHNRDTRPEKVVQMATFNPQLPASAQRFGGPFSNANDSGVAAFQHHEGMPAGGTVGQSPPRSGRDSAGLVPAVVVDNQSRGSSWKEKLSSFKMDDQNFYEDDEEEEDDEEDDDAANNAKRTLLKKASKNTPPVAPSAISQMSNSFSLLSGRKPSKGSAGGGKAPVEDANDDLSTIELYGTGKSAGSRKPLLSSRRDSSDEVTDTGRDKYNREGEKGRDTERKHSKANKEQRSKSKTDGALSDSLGRRKKSNSRSGPSTLSDYVGLSSGGEN